MTGHDDDRELVYSSEQDWIAPRKREPKRPGGGKPRVLPGDGVVRVLRERRRGGVVSVVAGLRDDEFEQTAKQLKRLCGAGGTAKGGIVEIQGDHRERIVAWFVARGRKAKSAGG